MVVLFLFILLFPFISLFCFPSNLGTALDKSSQRHQAPRRDSWWECPPWHRWTELLQSPSFSHEVWCWDARSLTYHKPSKLFGSLSVLLQREKSMEVWHSGKLPRVNKDVKRNRNLFWCMARKPQGLQEAVLVTQGAVFFPLSQSWIHAWVWPHLKYGPSDSTVPMNTVLEGWLVVRFSLENSHPGRVQAWPT